MKVYTWNAEKNRLLTRQRGVSFEEVVFHIQRGDEIDVFDHPNQDQYPGQKVSVVLIETYVYLVSFVESDETLFLKTIIPSRKATKQYLGEDNDKT